MDINEFGGVEDAKVKIYVVDNIMENKEIILLTSVSYSFQPVSPRSYAIDTCLRLALAGVTSDCFCVP